MKTFASTNAQYATSIRTILNSLPLNAAALITDLAQVDTDNQNARLHTYLVNFTKTDFLSQSEGTLITEALALL